MSKRRNDDATCRTCPYWEPTTEQIAGKCRRLAPRSESGQCEDVAIMYPDEWCGEHPNFWRKETPDAED